MIKVSLPSFIKNFKANPNLVVFAPYLWLILFFLIPFLIVFKISFSEAILKIPPYTDLVKFTKDSLVEIKISLASYKFLLTDDLYVSAYLSSIKLAAISTVGCLLLGYPIAFLIARSPQPWQTVLLMLVILPFWTSFLIRVYAWINLLSVNGLLNNFFITIGLIDEPLQLINNNFAVCLGFIYCYLPFMVFPLYTVIEKLDYSLIEAASDLGARPLKRFLTITLPLSMPGIIAGSLLVFIPAVGEFVIPDLLGGTDTLMMGKVLWNEFFHNHDWPASCAVAVALLIILVIPVTILQKIASSIGEDNET